MILSDGIFFGHRIGVNNEIDLTELKKIYRLMTKMREHLETDQDKEDFLAMANFFSRIQICAYKEELHLVPTYKEYFEELNESAERR